MESYFTLSSLKRLILTISSAFSLLLPYRNVDGQVKIVCGTMYNPQLVTLKAESYYNDVVYFKAYQYQTLPTDPYFPPLNAGLLYRGGGRPFFKL